MDTNTVEELLKQGRAADREDLERAELWRAMVKGEGWKMYVEVLNSHLQTLSDRLLAPAHGVDGAIFGEYIKGAMSSLILARDLPGATIESMKAARSEDEDDVAA